MKSKSTYHKKCQEYATIATHESSLESERKEGNLPYIINNIITNSTLYWRSTNPIKAPTGFECRCSSEQRPRQHLYYHIPLIGALNFKKKRHCHDWRARILSKRLSGLNVDARRSRSSDRGGADTKSHSSGQSSSTRTTLSAEEDDEYYHQEEQLSHRQELIRLLERPTGQAHRIEG